MAVRRRNTRQREIILETIGRMERHVTAEDVYAEVSRTNPEIGKATVFRNMAVLAEEGHLLCIEVPDGPRRFEKKASNHYHAKCRICGKLLDVDMEYIPDLVDKVRDSHGFQFSGHDIIFTGICSSCSHKEEKDKEKQI